MTTISVPDMMCENCVKRITNALTEADLKFTVSLADKTVTIDGCQNCVKTAVGELEDLGFTPGSPEISSRYFVFSAKLPLYSFFGYRGGFLPTFVTALLLFDFFCKSLPVVFRPFLSEVGNIASY